MSSNIKVTRICQYCNTGFIAQTTVTKYCSLKCAQRAYKARKKEEKLNKSTKETKAIISKPIEELKTKEYLTLKEASMLLGISIRTFYRIIKKKELDIIKIGSRTIIERVELNKFLNNSKI